ncbi:MAG TPA: TolC family protein [Myxococcaceae bacterium]|nr:TolC family protein [Myxococcaceae bacterium]
MIRIPSPVATALALVVTSAAAVAAEPDSPLLRLDEAVSLARGDNHSLAATALELDKTEERTAALRTRRYPSFRFDTIGMHLLNSPTLSGSPGSFGNSPALGPIPLIDNVNKTTAIVGAIVSQPLTQQYRIALQLDELKLDHQIASEDLRKDRQRVTADVKSAYYHLSATSAGILALRDLVKAIEDVDALTTRYLAEGRVLRSEALEVKARLARERQHLSATENDFDTEHERLNQLLGRDLVTPYRVATPSELVALDQRLSLESVRQKAVENRAEIRKDTLRIEKAQTARRIADSQWIPDVSLFASYNRNINYTVVPKEIATVGVWLTWEPWDWGRRFHEAHEQGAAADQARQNQRETTEKVSVEVGQRWRGVRDAAARLEAARVSEEAASAYLTDTRNRYREDATLLNDVLEAEARLSAARRDFTDALAGYWSATAELERTIGDANS